MTLGELKEWLDEYLRVQPRNSETTLVIDIARPSMGPTDSIPVDHISLGFDWNSGKAIIYAKERLVKKHENMDIYDMARDTMYSLYTEAFHKKRKPWYFDRIETIYRRIGILETMQKIASNKI